LSATGRLLLSTRLLGRVSHLRANGFATNHLEQDARDS
jgi:hypothetical protein